MVDVISPRTEGLTFGAVDLLMWEYNDAGWMITVQEDDASNGNPEPVIQRLSSWLQDGTLVEVTGYDNRVDVRRNLLIRATSADALDLGEQALVAEVGKRNRLVSIPPAEDANGVASVLEVETSRLDEIPDPAANRQLIRRFTLIIEAQPFISSLNPVVTLAELVPSNPITTLIADGTSAAGWTGQTFDTNGNVVSTPVSSVDGTLQAFGPAFWNQSESDSSFNYGNVYVSMTYAPSAPPDVSGTPYLMVNTNVGTATTENGILLGLSASVNGRSLSLLANDYTSGVAPKRFWFRLPAGTTTLPTVVFSGAFLSAAPQPDTPSGGTFVLDNLQVTNVTPGGTSQHERWVTVAVKGTARTPASLRVSHESQDLGETVVYTHPSPLPGYFPSLRPRRISGTTTADDSTISGSYGDFTADVPCDTLDPTGVYLVMAAAASRISSGQVEPVKTVLQMVKPNGALLTAPKVTLNGSVTGGPSVGKITLMGLVQLPLLDTPPGAGWALRVATTTSTTYEPAGTLDDVWLFHMADRAALAWLSDTGNQRLWLNAATVDVPQPKVWVGDAADGSDRYNPGGISTDTIKSWGDHHFIPPSAAAQVITRGAQNPDIALIHTPHWTHHAGRVEVA